MNLQSKHDNENSLSFHLSYGTYVYIPPGVKNSFCNANIRYKESPKAGKCISQTIREYKFKVNAIKRHIFLSELLN